MRDTGWDSDKAAGWVALELGGIKSFSFTEIPCPVDNGHQFVIRVRVRENAPGNGIGDACEWRERQWKEWDESGRELRRQA